MADKPSEVLLFSCCDLNVKWVFAPFYGLRLYNTALCYTTATFMTQGFMVAERKVAQKKDRYITKSEALCNRLSEA